MKIDQILGNPTGTRLHASFAGARCTTEVRIGWGGPYSNFNMQLPLHHLDEDNVK
jgi:hypothetical protein